VAVPVDDLTLEVRCNDACLDRIKQLDLEQDPRLVREPRADVPRDGGGSRDATGVVADRGEADDHLHPATIPGHPFGFQPQNCLTLRDRRQAGKNIRTLIGREGHRDRLPDRLVRRPAVEPFGAPVPAGDGAIELGAEDRLLGVLDDRRQVSSRLLD
jgi:hypothetical protein